MPRLAPQAVLKTVVTARVVNSSMLSSSAIILCESDQMPRSKNTVIYKIRRKSDGLFSTGGWNPEYSKTGKTWKRKGDLSNHFALMCDQYYTRLRKTSMNSVYEGCEIVAIEIVEVEKSVMPVEDWWEGDRFHSEDF